jgi:ZIP family zinc transporter
VNSALVTLLGAFAGLTIFFGLPVARLRGLQPAVQGFLNSLATGVLVFLLVDILRHAGEQVNDRIPDLHRGNVGGPITLVLVYMVGMTIGLAGLAWFNQHFSRIVPSVRSLALMIAIGLGLHNFSEGLAIGQSASVGALAFTGVLLVGFGLHNVTEGFGVAAPMAIGNERPSWSFLVLAGLIGGGPTFLGTMVGYHVVSPYAFVLFLTLAAGALIYVINEMFTASRRLNSPTQLAGGILVGFLAGFGTDLFLSYAGG